MEDLNKIKQSLISQLEFNYKALTHCISQMPVQDEFKQRAFQHLDTGILWVEKSIMMLQVQEDLDIECQEQKKEALTLG